MHYKRKGHRGRSKKQGTKNQTGRCHGNSESKAIYYGGTYKNIHRSASQRNKVEKSETEWDDAR